jgi:hypothetical protein
MVFCNFNSKFVILLFCCWLLSTFLLSNVNPQFKNVILFQLVIIVTTWKDTNGPPDVVVDAFSAFSESTGTINFDKNEGEVRLG